MATKTNRGNNSSNNFMSSNNTRTLLTLLTGAVAGAVTALLLAPQAGTETRRAIRSTTSRLRDDLGNTISQGLEKISALRGGSELTDEAETSDTITNTGAGTTGSSYGATGRRLSNRGAGNPSGLGTTGTTTGRDTQGGIGNV